MPVNATPTTTPIITLDEIRMFMRDVAGQVPGTQVENIMFDELPEFSNDDITRAIKFTVARFNVITPPSSDTQDSINIWLLLVGCAGFLCLSESFRQQRNQVTYQDGDIQPIGVDDKTALYREMANLLNAEFESKSQAYKISRNLESAYGSLGSGYRAVSRFHHSS
jgi:hypothetical protein